MKEVWSVVVVTLEVLCFVLFFIPVRPDEPIAFRDGNGDGYCRMNSSAMGVCGSHLFAAVSDRVGRWQRKL